MTALARSVPEAHASFFAPQSHSHDRADSRTLTTLLTRAVALRTLTPLGNPDAIARLAEVLALIAMKERQ